MGKNRKPGRCCWCDVAIDIGQGNLFYVGEEDENLGFGPMGVTGWLVSCVDRTACQDRRKEAKAKSTAVRTERERIKLRENELFPAIQESFAGFPENGGGQHPYPDGTEYAIDGKGHNIYGGGCCYIVSRDQIWKLLNNGLDGDNWSRNNVRTGGAGAIGYIFAATEERRQYLLTYAVNMTLAREQRRKEKQEAETAENTRIKAGLEGMLARGITWEQIAGGMKKASNTFCPRELLRADGKPSCDLTLAQAQRIVGHGKGHAEKLM